MSLSSCRHCFGDDGSAVGFDAVVSAVGSCLEGGFFTKMKIGFVGVSEGPLAFPAYGSFRSGGGFLHGLCFRAITEAS